MIAPPTNGRILLARAEIESRVRELGVELTEHYRGERPLVLGVMNGALFFLADLLRAVEFDLEIACLRLASYAGTKSRGTVLGLEALDSSPRGRRVLIVDDILDTGTTLAHLSRRLAALGAMEVKICVLLEKVRAREVRADWTGFRIPDAFVVGYGLDLDGRYRNLRDVYALDPAED